MNVNRRRAVTLIQPYLPRYRYPLFERCHTLLAELDIGFEVLHGAPLGDQAWRGDAVGAAFAEAVRTRAFRVGRASLRWKPVVRRTAPCDLTIVELAAGAVESLVLCAQRPARTALWGHGYSAVSSSNWLDTRIEAWMMRRARHVFVYTERGAAAAKRAGALPSRVSVLNNTIDTSAIVGAADRLDRPESARRLGLSAGCLGPVGAFIGGLDQSKRIAFLLAAADLIHRSVPTFSLLVAGDGVCRRTIEAAAASRPWLRYIGPIDDQRKGAVANVADVLLNPGRIGLIAIDSFAMAVPIVTTDWPLHAPEVDYLDDRTAVFTRDTAEDYASAVVTLFRDQPRRRRLADACRAERSRFSIDAMARRFVDGVSAALEPP